MMTNHILVKEGILVSFSVSKKIGEEKINEFKKKLKNPNALDENKLKELLKQSIIDEYSNKFDINKIPGFIGNNFKTNDKEEDKKIVELTYFASLIAKKITEKKMDKYYSCYIINALVNILKLNDEDFNEFHKRFSKYRGEEPEGPEESESGYTSY